MQIHNENIRSVLVVTELFPNERNSFLGTFVVGQLRILAKNYTVVVLTTYDFGIKGLITKRHPEYCAKEGMQVYYINGFSFIIWLLRCIKLLSHQRYMIINKKIIRKRIKEKAEQLNMKYDFKCVLGHSVYVGDESVKIGKVLGIPSVLVIHGVYWHDRKIFGSCVMKNVIASANNANKVVAVSKIALDSYRENGLINPNNHIVANGVVIRELGGDHMFKDFGKGKIVLLSVGFFSKEKRVDRVIQALKYLHDTGINNSVLIIVGKGEQEKYLRRLVNRLELGKHVVFSGEINPSDMEKVYNACDILVHPSIVESFSMVCLEAMSLGKPVVCTSNIGLIEYIQPGIDSIVVSPDNQQELNEAVYNLGKSVEYRRKIGEAARKTAEKMSWEKHAEKMKTIIEDLVK